MAEHVMQIKGEYIDSSLEDKYYCLKEIIEETGIYPEEGLENSIRNIVKDKANKRTDIGSEEEHNYTYRYALAFPFADRTLDRAMKDDRIKGTRCQEYLSCMRLDESMVISNLQTFFVMAPLGNWLILISRAQ